MHEGREAWSCRATLPILTRAQELARNYYSREGHPTVRGRADGCESARSMSGKVVEDHLLNLGLGYRRCLGGGQRHERVFVGHTVLTFRLLFFWPCIGGAAQESRRIRTDPLAAGTARTEPLSYSRSQGSVLMAVRER